MDAKELYNRTRGLQTFLYHSNEQACRTKIPEDVGEIIQDFLRKPERFFKMILPKYRSEEIKKAWNLIDEYKEQLVSLVKAKQIAASISAGNAWSEDLDYKFEKSIQASVLLVKHFVTIDSELLNLIINKVNKTTFSDPIKREAFLRISQEIIYRNVEIINQTFHSEIKKLHFNESKFNFIKNLNLINEYIYAIKNIIEIKYDLKTILKKENLVVGVDIYEELFCRSDTLIHKLMLNFCRQIDFYAGLFSLFCFYICIKTILKLYFNYVYNIKINILDSNLIYFTILTYVIEIVLVKRGYSTGLFYKTSFRDQIGLPILLPVLLR